MISVERLYELGLSERQIRWRVRHGFLDRRHRGVYGVGHTNLTHRGKLRAALLTLGPTAFLNHRTGAARHGLRPLNIHAIEVTVVADHTPRRPGLIVHRTAEPPHPSEVRERYGFRVASVPRVLVDLAPRETPLELMGLITEAARKGNLSLRAMEETLARHERRPGVGILKDVYARYRPGPDRKSGLERSFDAYAKTDPRIPPYEKNIHLGPYEIDCLWPGHALACELDGRPYHVALQDMDKDRIKDVWLQRRGLRVIRITDFRWDYDRDAAVDDLLALLALGDARAA